MKKMIVGAGALLLSSSALIGVGQANVTSAPLVYGTSAAWAVNPAMADAAVDAGMTAMKPAQAGWTSDSAAMGKEKEGGKPAGEEAGWTDKNMLPASLTTGAMSYQEAAAWTGDKPAEVSAEHQAEKQAWLAQNVVEDVYASIEPADGKPMAASAAGVDSTMMQTAEAKPMAGQGGPLESAEAERTAWPACDPGPGDDRCIQLYERGVSRAFAQWQAGRERLAMGGPEEPVSGKDVSATANMSGAGDMAAADKPDTGAVPTTEPTGAPVSGKSASAEHAHAMMEQSAMAAPTMTAEQMQANSAMGSQQDGVYTGVGGPVEEPRSYPRCRSRSDDRCTQI